MITNWMSYFLFLHEWSGIIMYQSLSNCSMELERRYIFEKIKKFLAMSFEYKI